MTVYGWDFEDKGKCVVCCAVNGTSGGATDIATDVVGDRR